MAQQGEELKGKIDESQKGQNEQKEQSVQQQEEKNAEDSQEKPKNQSQSQSLFSGLNSGQNLFNNSGINLKPGQLFTGNILSSSTQPTSELFSQLFKNTNVEINCGKTQSEINQQISKPAENNNQDDDEEDDDEEDQKYLYSDFKYEQNADLEQIIKQDLEKFRRNANQILEKGTVSIEKAKNEESYFFIYRNQTQQIIYAGQLIKGLSKTRPLGQKQENLLLKAVSKKEQENQQELQQVDDKKQLVIDILKLMFTTKEGAEEFKKQLEKVLQ
ncbi:unnamed protein product [Paramecium sonneborni]|uniref:Uncharacterized protein n=1 Tax=Paramecium sonneborni TaxID=65129 RepID=A0A8S1MUY7_9CILI|nr:unnamed protein product [Paramecium sonneborni]